MQGIKKELEQRFGDLMVAALRSGIDAGTTLCHARSVANGWYKNEEIAKCVPIKLLLIHSEISEATEAFRKDLQDDKLVHRLGIEVELADAIIRIFDLAGYLQLDLSGAVLEKLLYNEKRSDHKMENRTKPGGKKF